MTYPANLYGQIEAMKRAQGVDDVRQEMKRHRQALSAKLDEHEVAVKGDIRDPNNPVNRRCWRWAFLSLALLSLALLLAASCKNGIVC